MDPKFALPLVSFLMSDVGGGLGPFLSTWLAEVRKWSPDQVGAVMAVGALAGAALSTPAGSLIDRFGRPRLMLAGACALIMGGTILLMPFQAVLLVGAAQVIVSAGGALGGPAMNGLTLSVVGRDLFPRQQGTNDAANHAGNVTAALAIAGLSAAVGPVAAIIVLAVMAIATIAVLLTIRREKVDGERMRGRKPRQRGEKRGLTRNIMKDWRIWALLAVVGLFQLGNSAMLPLLGQRVVAADGSGTAWMSACVIVAQLTMVPIALATGRLVETVGVRKLLLFACCVVVARCGLAAVAAGNWWLIPIQVLDGVAAGVFSVTAPSAMTFLTYGSGRTQTAMGAMATLLAGGAAAASFGGGLLAQHVGYAATFGIMAAFPVIAAALLMTIRPEKTARYRGAPPDDASPDDASAGPAPEGLPAPGNAAASSAAA